MLLKKKRIRSIKNNIPFLKEGQKIYVGINFSEELDKKIKEIGFSSTEIGVSVLPNSSIGSISNFNAEGKYIKNKKLPKETAYREVEWHWKQWRGRGETEEMSKTVYVPYERYQRDYILPPSIELSILSKTDGTKIIASPVVEYSEKNEKDLVHIINLVLEIFGECQIFSDNLEEIIKTPLIRLNWRILPKGKMPWSKLKGEVSPILKKVGSGKRAVVENRLEIVNGHGSIFCAVGEAGFLGYVVFGFPDKGLYLMESSFYGNATYVFGNNWEELSKRTKADILKESLQKDRIIHQKGWEEKIDELLK